MGNDIVDQRGVLEALREAKQAAENSQTQYEQVVSMISDIVWRYDVNDLGEHVLHLTGCGQNAGVAGRHHRKQL